PATRSSWRSKGSASSATPSERKEPEHEIRRHREVDREGRGGGEGLRGDPAAARAVARRAGQPLLPAEPRSGGSTRLLLLRDLRRRGRLQGARRVRALP